MGSPGTIRYPELDACRGIAIIMMVIFHLVFDVSFFSWYPIQVDTGFWRIFAGATASLFILIAGVAVSIKASWKGAVSAGEQALPFIKRGITLLVAGFIVTIGTYVALRGEGYVVFGILHLLGVSTILSPLFFRMGRMAALPGGLIIVTGWISTLPYGTIWLAWIGMHPPCFYSVDYVPLIPWFGVFLLGMAGGSMLYADGQRSFQMPSVPDGIMRPLATAGRHSLLIYFVHQPIIIAFLSVIFKTVPGW